MLIIGLGATALLALRPRLFSVTAEVAERTVASLPEVQSYAQTLAQSGAKATITAEDAGETWNVHIYEIVQDGDSSHTATFGWYTVDKKTGRVEKTL